MAEREKESPPLILNDDLKTDQLERRIVEVRAEKSIQTHFTTRFINQLVTSPTVEDLYRRTVTLLNQYRYPVARFLRFDPAEETLIPVANSEKGAYSEIFPHYQANIGDNLLETVAATGISILKSDLYNDPTWPFPNIPQGLAGEIVLPIRGWTEDANVQAERLRYFIAANLDGFAVSPFAPKVVAPVVQEAKDKGMAVVVYDNDLGEGRPTAVVSDLGYDSGYKLGSEAGTWAQNRFLNGETIQIGILTHHPSKICIEREKGILEGIKHSFNRTVEVIGTVNAPDATRALPIAEKWIREFPNLKIIVGVNDAGALGAFQAVVEAGKNNSETFFVGGIDATNDALRAIQEKGAYQATIAQSPRERGARVVCTLAAAVAGIPFQTQNIIKGIPVNQSNFQEFVDQQKGIKIEQIIADQGLAGVNLENIKFGLNVATLYNSYFKATIKGAKEAAELLGVKLIISDATPLLGVLDIQSPQSDLLDLEDLDMLEGLCGVVSATIDKHRIEAKRQRAMNEVSQYRDQLENLVEERTKSLERVNIKLHQEIAEHARVGQELITSEKQYRLLAENVKDGIVIIQNGKICFANQTFSEMSHKTNKQLLKTDPVNLFSVTNKDVLSQRLKNNDIILDSGHWRVELKSKEEKTIWVEVRQTDIFWNSHLACLLNIRDIDEQVHRERLIEKERARLEQENIKLKSTIKDRYQVGFLVGKSLSMQRVYELILNTTMSDVNVLIVGESGTGKELIARTLHHLGPRTKHKFVPVNCASIPESLFEREFFGHRKGAFTGAERDKPGLFDQAHCGTLFLDEVTELRPSLQAKLLRVLQDGEYMPLGSPVPKKTNVAIIAATNKNCQVEIEQKRLREDFFYRIAVMEISVPPLRDRKDDLPLLVEHILGQFRKKQKELSTQSISDIPSNQSELPSILIQALYNYNWPGNVRELENILQRFLVTRNPMVAISQISSINPRHLNLQSISIPNNIPLPEAVKIFEKQKILEVLTANQFDVQTSAKKLGIPTPTLYYKIKYYHLKDKK